MKYIASYIPGIILVLSLCLIIGCGDDKGRNTGDRPSTTEKGTKSAEKEYILIPVKCTIHHSGYKAVIVSPGVAKPLEGTVVSLECNGQDVELSGDSIIDGHIETKNFGKIGVRFGSMITTVGAGDFTAVPPGKSIQEPVVEIYIEKSKQEEFMSKYSE